MTHIFHVYRAAGARGTLWVKDDESDDWPVYTSTISEATYFTSPELNDILVELDAKSGYEHYYCLCDDDAVYRSTLAEIITQAQQI